MKVGMILNFPPNDHRAVFYDGIARELVKLGYDVEIIMQKGELQFEDYPYKLTLIPGSTYSIIGQLKFILHAIKKIKNEEYDIIHARNPFSSLIPALLAKGKSKVIYDIRGLWVEFGVNAGYYPKWIGRILDFIDVRLAKMSDAIIAISPLMKKILMEKGIHKKIIEIVPEGVDVEKFSKAKPIDLREKFGIDGKIVGYVGSISVSRGSDKIIEAFKFVKKEVKDAYLVMVGPIRSEEEKYFRELVRKLGLEDSVVFTGFIEKHSEIPRYMKAFDVAVSYHPQSNEIYDVMVPIKILEYMAAGVPIVATNNLSHRNIIKDGIDGFLASGNPKTFANTLIAILENRRKLKKQIKNNQFNFSFYKISKKMNILYSNILSGRKY
jgi:glycosyltransferase involved in cell wall biosynthesis